MCLLGDTEPQQAPFPKQEQKETDVFSSSGGGLAPEPHKNPISSTKLSLMSDCFLLNQNISCLYHLFHLVQDHSFICSFIYQTFIKQYYWLLRKFQVEVSLNIFSYQIKKLRQPWGQGQGYRWGMTCPRSHLSQWDFWAPTAPNKLVTTDG